MRCESSTRCSINASLRSVRALGLGVVAILLGAVPAHAEAPLERPTRVASYTLTAKLDATEHRVTAHGTISLFNYTASTLGEIYLHLYMNAFKNDESLFLRSPFGAGRSGQHGGKWGYIDVKRLVERDSGRDLWPERARKSPGDPDDETDIRVPLATPLGPAQTRLFDVEFEVKLPQIVERTGYEGDYHFVAQWFPKLARLMPDGSFAHFAFHPQSEFAADFGSYDVTLDVPAGDVVGATGSCGPAAVPAPSGRRVLRCLADDVHDFAWTSWAGFRERRERVGSVDVRVLAPAGHERNAAIELDSVRFGLRHFGERFGSYPYATLTVVHPPDTAADSGGMEYPTLITTGGPWLTPWTGARAIEAVTIHELGHQWFYGLFASDEHRYPFLDEGLNSYAEHSALRARYGDASAFSGFGLRISNEALSRAVAAARGADEPIAQGAGDFFSFRSLGAIVYGRTASLLTTFERVYGKPSLDLALRDYANAARFRAPEPQQLLDAVRGRLGDAAARNLSRALYERGTVDYQVRDVQSVASDPHAGVFDEASGRRTIPRSEVRPAARFFGRAVVLRHGSLELPVQIELRLEDGRRERRSWDGEGTRYIVSYEGTSPLVGVTVDPESRVLLDDNLLNNAASRQDQGAPRSLERLLYAAELLLAGGLP
jgi:Peptidase family M1 domain